MYQRRYLSTLIPLMMKPDGDTGGGGDPKDPASGDGSGGDPADKGKDPKEAPTDKKKDSPDFDSAAFKDRLSRADAQTKKKLLADLGVDSVEDAAAKLKKLKEYEDAQLSATEKLEKDLAEAKKVADTERKARELRDAEHAAERQQDLIERQALKHKAQDSEMDVVTIKANKWIKEQGDDFKVTAESLEPFFAKLKTDKPGIFDAEEVPARTGIKADGPKAKASDPKQKSVNDMTPAEYAVWKEANGIT